MAQPTLAVRDANNIPQTIFTISPAGRAAAADSQSTAMATEDKAALDLVNTNLDACVNDLDSIDSSTSAINGKLATLGRKAAAGSSPSVLSTEDKAVLDAIAASLASQIATTGFLVPVAVEFNRPADVTAYAANDSVSDSTSAPTNLEFANIIRVNGGTGYLVRAILITNQPTNVAQFRLHLFNAAPSAGNDNAPYATLWAQRAAHLGFVDFDALQTEGTGSETAFAMWRQPLALSAAAGSRSIFAKLETKTAFTPASGQTFRLVLIVDQN